MPNVLDQFRLTGRVALVTGGSKGLGRVMAQALAEAGAEVAIASRTEAECQQAADEIAAATGRRTLAVAADVSKADAVEALAGAVETGLGPVDILVSNAGINIRGPIDKLTEAEWDAVQDINLKGPWLCARRFGPPMVARGWGRVINLASTLGAVAMADRTPYCSSKAGLINMTRVLAVEWAQSGVTVNALCPGPFATDMNKVLIDDPEKYAAFVAKIPMGRWGELEEIAGAALFLASPAASYVTGTTLFVDGGWTAQ